MDLYLPAHLSITPQALPMAVSARESRRNTVYERMHPSQLARLPTLLLYNTRADSVLSRALALSLPPSLLLSQDLEPRAPSNPKKKPPVPRLPKEAFEQQPTPPAPPRDLDSKACVIIGEKNFEVKADELEPIGELGRGAYGVVDKMKHVPSGIIMAVKVRDARMSNL
ncbi:dual specificity mitogen-activated protein kinase kinase 6 isoform X1 [Tachysurus ichikawai]